MIILSAYYANLTAWVGIITVFFLKYFKIVYFIINSPTWTSTALIISSNKRISLSEYKALASPILAFCPPDKFVPFYPIYVI